MYETRIICPNCRIPLIAAIENIGDSRNEAYDVDLSLEEGTKPFSCRRCETWYASMAEAEACYLACGNREPRSD